MSAEAEMLHSLQLDHDLDLSVMSAHGDFSDRDLQQLSVQSSGGHHAWTVSTLSSCVHVLIIQIRRLCNGPNVYYL